jgi:hypothetical protein
LLAGTKPPSVSPGREPHCDPHMAFGASSRPVTPKPQARPYPMRPLRPPSARSPPQLQPPNSVAHHPHRLHRSRSATIAQCSMFTHSAAGLGLAVPRPRHCQQARQTPPGSGDRRARRWSPRGCGEHGDTGRLGPEFDQHSLVDSDVDPYGISPCGSVRAPVSQQGISHLRRLPCQQTGGSAVLPAVSPGHRRP